MPPWAPRRGKAFTGPRMRKADYAKDLGDPVAHSQAIPNQPRRRLDQLPPVPLVTTAPLDRVRKGLAGAHRCWKPLRHGVPPPLGPVAAEPVLQPNFRGCTPSPISSKSMTSPLPSPLRISAGRNLPATIDVPAHASAHGAGKVAETRGPRVRRNMLDVSGEWVLPGTKRMRDGFSRNIITHRKFLGLMPRSASTRLDHPADGCDPDALRAALR